MDITEVLSPSVTVTELVVRGTLVFLGLMLCLRLVGQREAGGLGLTDLLVVVLIVDAASSGLTGDTDTIGDGFILVGTILFWSVALDAVSYRWPRLGRILKARPKPLIEDGRLNRRVMRRELMTDVEVFAQLRLHGVERLDQVHRAYLEPNGMISVVPADDEEHRPARLTGHRLRSEPGAEGTSDPSCAVPRAAGPITSRRCRSSPCRVCGCHG